MPKPAHQLPADPAQLHLAYAFGHGVRDGSHEQSIERWEVTVRHGFEVHDDARCATLAGPTGADECLGECPAYFEDGVQVGSMVFYRIRMQEGMNPFFMPPLLERRAVALSA